MSLSWTYVLYMVTLTILVHMYPMKPTLDCHHFDWRPVELVLWLCGFFCCHIQRQCKCAGIRCQARGIRDSVFAVAAFFLWYKQVDSEHFTMSFERSRMSDSKRFVSRYHTHWSISHTNKHSIINWPNTVRGWWSPAGLLMIGRLFAYLFKCALTQSDWSSTSTLLANNNYFRYWTIVVNNGHAIANSNNSYNSVFKCGRCCIRMMCNG